MANIGLFIGVGRYADVAIRPLRCSANDARSIASALKSHGQWRQQRVLTDEDSPDLVTRAQVLAEAKTCRENCTRNDVLYLFFSGHGFSLTVEKSRPLFLATGDCSLEDPGRTSVCLSDLLLALSETHADHIVLILDACRSRVQDPETRRNDEKDFASLLEDLFFHRESAFAKAVAAGGKSWHVLSACADDAVAKEGAAGTSLWTGALIDALDKIAEEVKSGKRTRPFTVRAWASRSRRSVAQLQGEQASPRQMPWCSFGRQTATVIDPVVKTVEPKTLGLFSASGDVSMYEESVHASSRNEYAFSLLSEPEVKDSETICLAPITTGHAGRDDIQRFEHLEIPQNNDDFRVRLYLPNLCKHKPPFRRLYFLANGLAESKTTIIDSIGMELAQQGIPAILVPLPRHMTRFVPDNEYEDPFRPPKDVEKLHSQQLLQSLIAAPEGLLFTMRQYSADITSLLKGLRVGSIPWASGLFVRDVKPSLCGYSIGGLYMLALMLQEFGLARDKIDTLRGMSIHEMRDDDIIDVIEKMAYETVFLLESGAPINQIDTGELFYRHSTICDMLWEHYVTNEKAAHNRRFWDNKAESLFAKGENAAEAALRAYLRGERGEKEVTSKVFERSREDAERVWRDVVVGLHESVGECLLPPLADIFRKVFLGENPIGYRAELEALNRRIMIATGGKDKIFPATLLLSGSTRGLATIQVPGMSHWLKAGGADHWGYWHRLLVELMIRFEHSAVTQE